MAYTDDLLVLVLDNYWQMREDGEMPDELHNASGRGERAPLESASVLVSDVDRALDALYPPRWAERCQKIELSDFYGDILRQTYSSLIWEFNFYQQAVMRYHWLDEKLENTNALRARKKMLRFLNRGIKPVRESNDAIQRLGGIARAKSLTPERRKEIAHDAAEARWARVACKQA